MYGQRYYMDVKRGPWRGTGDLVLQKNAKNLMERQGNQ